MSEYILEVRNISKTFPGVKALSNVNFKVKPGSVHALMGENGAGKSTLMKILYGIHAPDKGGEIVLDGQKFKPTKPIDAIRSGLTMVPQEISPARNLTIADNFYLGREICNGGFLDKKLMNQKVIEILESLGTPMNVTDLMENVSVAKAQLVAIATAVSYDSKVIIMDEPTTALTETEVAQLYEIIEKVKERGIAVIYISHKLDEIFATSSEVSVLRDGEYIGTRNVADISKEDLVEMMVGRSMTDMYDREEIPIGEKLLEVKNLQKEGCFHDVNFDLHCGEILGLAGLVGAGRTEIAEALFGYKPADSGEIIINGKHVQINTPNDAIAHKIGFVTEDRKQSGLFLNLNIMDNIIMPDITPYLQNFLVSTNLIKKAALTQKDALRIKAPNVQVITDNLSGGNQQKVLLARWLLLEPDILILDEPTKGIDVGARAEIYKIMVELAKMGKAIIMISSDMLELLAMSDRIMVMAEGKETGILDKKQASQELVLKLAAGEDIKDVLKEKD